MSRCVALCIAESSGQFYLSRCLNIRHRDRKTVERDIGYSHRDRLSPRNETNRNVSLAVLYISLDAPLMKFSGDPSLKCTHLLQVFLVIFEKKKTKKT